MMGFHRGDPRKIRSRSTGPVCFVGRLAFFAAAKREKRGCKKPTSDSREKEKIVSAWQQRLHRGIIDTLLVNRVARKF
jgi:hypothetical protein